MTVILQVLILFIFINTGLKLSFWRWWQVLVLAALAAGFSIWIYPYTANQSKTQLAEMMASPRIMQDLAVLVTLESALFIAYCFIALKEIFGKKVKYWGRFLFFHPGLLLFPALFYLQAQTIFSLPGTGFHTIAYTMAALLFVCIPLVSFGIKRLLPEKDLRLEVHFLVSLFICMLGLISTADGKVSYAAANNPMDWKALAIAVALFVVCFLSGYILYKLKWTFNKKKK